MSHDCEATHLHRKRFSTCTFWNQRKCVDAPTKQISQALVFVMKPATTRTVAPKAPMGILRLYGFERGYRNLQAKLSAQGGDVVGTAVSLAT